MLTMDQLLQETVEKGASDLHLSSGQPPLVRLHGDLQRLQHPELGPDAVTQLVNTLMSEEQRKRLVVRERD